MDRSDLRAHVFGQERRADQAPAQGHDRAQTRGGVQAGDRRPLLGRRDRLARRPAHELAGGGGRRAKSPSGSTGAPKWWASTRPISWVRSWWRWRSAWPTAASRSSSPGWIRITWGGPFAPIPDLLAHAESITKTLAICVRCGNPGQAHAAAARVRRPDRGGRVGHVRSALPPVLRAGDSEADGDGFRESETGGEERRVERPVYSDQTASSLPLGSLKWNRRPPGNEKVGFTMAPPAAFTLDSISSRLAA